MRKIIIAGNWKMYKNVTAAAELVNELKDKVASIKKTGIIVCPPATNLTTVCEIVKDTNIGVGAQNIHWEEQGAYTGENSADMVKSTGAEYVIIGHSERRQYFGETDETVNKKLNTALEAGLKPIVCIGEVLEERESGITKDVVKTQLTGALQGISAENMQNIIIKFLYNASFYSGGDTLPKAMDDNDSVIEILESAVTGSGLSFTEVMDGPFCTSNVISESFKVTFLPL